LRRELILAVRRGTDKGSALTDIFSGDIHRCPGRKHCQVFNVGDNADVFSQLVVVVARHKSQAGFLGWEFQLIEDIRSSKMTPTESATDRASNWLQVTIEAVIEVVFDISLISTVSLSRSLTSRFEKGSSKSSNRGSGAMALASATRCRCAPDSSWGKARAESLSPTSSSRRSTLCRRFLREVFLSPKPIQEVMVENKVY
jgi:hypothetical protein